MSVEQVGSHKTSIFTENSVLKVCYHNTIVIEITNESIVLRCGGYYTNTTKRRMNQASIQYNLGIHVYQVNYDWYVGYNGKVLPFEDGMIIKREPLKLKDINEIDDGVADGLEMDSETNAGRCANYIQP